MNEAHLLQEARNLFVRALRACSVDDAFERQVRVTRRFGGDVLHVGRESVDLAGVRHVCIVAAGKAAAAMLTGFLSRAHFAPDCELKGVLISGECPADLPRGIEHFAGGHPLPNQHSFEGARAALDCVLEAARVRDALCLFLISGGASAMMELPFDPAITLEDTAVLYQVLVHSGATIAEINCIRKHFSAVKGGRLALAAGATRSLTLLVSDVAPQQLDSLSSGPTLPDPTTIVECRELLARYALPDRVPESIRAYFASPLLQETPKAGDFVPHFSVLLDSDNLAAAAARHASALGYHVVVDHSCDDWPYDLAAEYLLSRIRDLRGRHRRVCLLSAGEVTVSVPQVPQQGGTPVGGRNQHFALYMALLMKQSDWPMAVLSAGSDGVDGNSLAAGGVVGSGTLQVREHLHAAKEALREFDSSTFLAACDATVVTGPTGNNLRDLRILLAEGSDGILR